MTPDVDRRWEATGRAAQALEDVSDGVIVLDEAWTIVYANANAARFVSRTTTEMLDRSFWEVFPEAYDHEFGVLYRTAMATQEPKRLEAYYGPLQGWFDVRVVPTAAGLSLFFSQVNERRRSETTQRALIARLEVALTRQSQTQAVVIALAEAMSVDDVAAMVEELATATLGTSFAAIALPNEARTHLAFVGVDDEPSIPASTPGSIDQIGESATATVPLVAGGRAVGLLVLRWPLARGFDETDRSFLRMLGSQAGLAVERTTVIGRQRNVAETLQQAMLPDELPDVAGVEVRACYLPATVDMSVGGDWYDAFTLPDGRIVFAVGDVSGHGVEAAAVMGQVRHSLRAYMVDVEAPSLALSKLDEVISRSGHGLFATVIVGIYDPPTGVLVWANAGHPPLVLWRRGGSRYLASAGGVPVGVGHVMDHIEERITLAVGDTVVAYTDGLIERRGEDLDVGMARLVSSVDATALTLGSDEWCTELVEHAIGDSHRDDDICVLALRRTAPPGSFGDGPIGKVRLRP